jgi:hypothetical protein
MTAMNTSSERTDSKGLTAHGVDLPWIMVKFAEITSSTE